MTLTLNLQELIDELGVYILHYDRAGYGQSDPNPKRTLKSEALDIEELADQLQIGSKFYVIGVSMGSHATWSCLNYIPNRLLVNSIIKFCGLNAVLIIFLKFETIFLYNPMFCLC